MTIAVTLLGLFAKFGRPILPRKQRSNSERTAGPASAGLFSDREGKAPRQEEERVYYYLAESTRVGRNRLVQRRLLGSWRTQHHADRSLAALHEVIEEDAPGLCSDRAGYGRSGRQEARRQE